MNGYPPLVRTCFVALCLLAGWSIAAVRAEKPPVDCVNPFPAPTGTRIFYPGNAAGFYPFCPGNPVYLLGGPLFTRTTLHLANGKTSIVRANGNAPGHRYIQSARLDGQPFEHSWLSHDEVTRGGTLDLEMGAEPNRLWASGPADAAPDDLPLPHVALIEDAGCGL